jgi:3-isopropylmalate/(R)-2-methylmalate dehydratase small subunit
LNATIQNSGRAWVFGNNIDTDQLAPGTYMKRPIEEIARHCLQAADPQFAGGVRQGDIVVGGRNFGMGSSREQAPQALRQLGVSAVLAPSFGGIFYRNALNLGLLALVCPEAGKIAAGDQLALEPESGKVHNLTRNESYASEPIPAHLVEMVQAGGLVPYLERRRASQSEKGRPA